MCQREELIISLDSGNVSGLDSLGEWWLERSSATRSPEDSVAGTWGNAHKTPQPLTLWRWPGDVPDSGWCCFGSRSKFQVNPSVTCVLFL